MSEALVCSFAARFFPRPVLSEAPTFSPASVSRRSGAGMQLRARGVAVTWQRASGEDRMTYPPWLPLDLQPEPARQRTTRAEPKACPASV